MIRAVIVSSRTSLAARFIAYGSFFYLVFVPDLIPDCLPVFGMLDDFMVLGIAADFFIKEANHKR